MEYNYVLLLVIKIFDKHNHSYYIILQWVVYIKLIHCSVMIFKLLSLFIND